ncbi:MAG TPA: OB-fold domain-containing protein [Candidatus Binataceae bacterium]|nr:OB-fold domain-containing protein [Candidatus Binataceae bacterium]
MAEQAQAATDTGPRPIVPFLKLEPKPHLVALKCSSCGSFFLDPKRVACSKCGSTKEKFSEVSLSDKGKVYVFSVVHQSYPGIKTPFVTAIIDLPEGVSVRANLVDIDPEAVQKEPKKYFDLPVEMVTNVASKDREGHDVIAFAYKPAKN